jgi:uncharacterized membrane protein
MDLTKTRCTTADIQSTKTKCFDCMLHYYQLIFYVAYRFFINLGRKSDPHAKAAIVLSIWSMFYLLILFAIVREFWLPHLLFPKSTVVIAFVAVSVLHLMLLICNRRHLSIYREFKRKPEYAHTYGVIIFAVYIILPIAFLILFTLTIWK